jgi:CTD kinase subunit gamma
LNIFDHAVLDTIATTIQKRKMELSELPSSAIITFSKQDILRRMEEDRERQKRLRERAWILPAKSFYDSMPLIKPTSAAAVSLRASAHPTTVDRSKEVVAAAAAAAVTTTDPLDVEFNYVWDNVDDLNEDDLERIRVDHDVWWSSRYDKREADRDAAARKEAPATPSRKRKAEGMEQGTLPIDTNRRSEIQSKPHQFKQPPHWPPRAGLPPDHRNYERAAR